jgi:hypothetical protein
VRIHSWIPSTGTSVHYGTYPIQADATTQRAHSRYWKRKKEHYKDMEPYFKKAIRPMMDNYKRPYYRIKRLSTNKREMIENNMFEKSHSKVCIGKMSWHKLKQFRLNNHVRKQWSESRGRKEQPLRISNNDKAYWSPKWLRPLNYELTPQGHCYPHKAVLKS